MGSPGDVVKCDENHTPDDVSDRLEHSVRGLIGIAM